MMNTCWEPDLSRVQVVFEGVCAGVCTRICYRSYCRLCTIPPRRIQDDQVGAAKYPLELLPRSFGLLRPNPACSVRRLLCG